MLGDLIGLVFLFALPMIPAVMAQSRGRNPVAWYLFGLVAWVLAVILLLVLPDLNVIKAREQQVDRRAQRLQEELDAERRRSEHFRREAERRLDVHDKALGLHSRVEELPGAVHASPSLVDLGDPLDEADGDSAPTS